MNNARRKILEAAITKLEAARDDVNEVFAKERDAYLALPWHGQNSEAGQQTALSATALQNTLVLFDDIINSVKDAKQ